MDDPEEEDGLCLDNDSLIVTGDDGIPIKGFDGQRTTLTHEQQARMRTVDGCGHTNTRLDLEMIPGRGGKMKYLQAGRMSYRCADCGVIITEGHVSEFSYQLIKAPNDFNNPFLTGQH